MRRNIGFMICLCAILVAVSACSDACDIGTVDNVFGENYQLMISDFAGTNVDVEVPFCPYQTTSDTIEEYILCDVDSFNSICEYAIRNQDFTRLTLKLEGCPAYLSYMLKNNHSDEYYMICFNFNYNEYTNEQIVDFTSNIRDKVEKIAPNKSTTVYKSEDGKTNVYCDILPIPGRDNVIGITSMRIEYSYDTQIFKKVAV